MATTKMDQSERGPLLNDMQTMGVPLEDLGDAIILTGLWYPPWKVRAGVRIRSMGR